MKTDRLLLIPTNIRGLIAVSSLVAAAYITYQILFSSNGNDLYSRTAVAGLGLFGVALGKRSLVIRNFCRAFCTVKIIMGVFILFFVAAILFPVFSKARATSNHDSPRRRMNQLGMAFNQYIQDYDSLPHGNRAQIMEAMIPYISQNDWTDNPQPRPLSLWNFTKYEYFSLNSVVFQTPRSVFDQHERETVVAFAPDTVKWNGADERLVLFLDGHYETIPESSFVLLRHQTMSRVIDFAAHRQ